MTPWSPDSICLRPARLNIQSLAKSIYDRTCRTDFTSPGFCVLPVSERIGSLAFRQLMVDLKEQMSVVHQLNTGKSLACLSAARFDQQETTRPHLDAGPEECFLMLGYEPSRIDSQLEISDYSKCAFDLGISPKQFLAEHNPMFGSGSDRLRPYSTLVPCFSATDYQIVCINNSSAAYSESHHTWQGTLHTATILTPDESQHRVINSIVIAPAPANTPQAVDTDQLDDFLSTSLVRRRGYDKPHLDDETSP